MATLSNSEVSELRVLQNKLAKIQDELSDITGHLMSNGLKHKITGKFRAEAYSSLSECNNKLKFIRQTIDSAVL